MTTYLPQIIISVCAVFLTIVSRFMVGKVIRKFATLNEKLETRTEQIIRVCSILINITGIIILIVIWGVDPRNLWVALSSIFAVIGVALFAQWSILSNITAGMIIFFTSPFKVGDYIKILDKDFPMEVKVENIHTFYTHLRSRDGELYVFPNSLLLQKAVGVCE